MWRTLVSEKLPNWLQVMWQMDQTGSFHKGSELWSSSITQQDDGCYWPGTSMSENIEAVRKWMTPVRVLLTATPSLSRAYQKQRAGKPIWHPLTTHLPLSRSRQTCQEVAILQWSVQRDDKWHSYWLKQREKSPTVSRLQRTNHTCLFKSQHGSVIGLVICLCQAADSRLCQS